MRPNKGRPKSLKAADQCPLDAGLNQDNAPSPNHSQAVARRKRWADDATPYQHKRENENRGIDQLRHKLSELQNGKGF